MAKNFSNAGSAKKIKEVAKASNEKANIIQVKMISSDNLIDYPYNNEDLTQTADLELSMKENGFTDPIEVTSFNMEDGKYMIVSGHRRRVAGIKVGYDTFPCIIKSFSNELDVKNYVLSSNAVRNAVADPLLYCKRYKMHEAYLKEANFSGSYREEIAKRLGISVQQADRYNKFNNVITDVWDMVRDEVVGMSSVMPMASHTPEEQAEILIMLYECLEQEQKLTRDMCDKIIKGYRDGKRSFLEIIQIELPNDTISGNENNSHINFGQTINDEPGETKEVIKNRNDEINYEGYEKEFENTTNENKFKDESLTKEDYETIDLVEKQNKDEKHPLSEQEKREQNADKLCGLLTKLENTLNAFYEFKDTDKVHDTMLSMSSLVRLMFAEMENMKNEYKIDDKEYDGIIDTILNDLKTYKA